jgi:hypothetical protein
MNLLLYMSNLNERMNKLCMGSCVGAHLSRSTFVLSETNAVAFFPHETNGTLKVYPKTTHLCDKCALIKFLRDNKAHFLMFLRDKKTHLSHVIFL